MDQVAVGGVPTVTMSRDMADAVDALMRAAEAQRTGVAPAPPITFGGLWISYWKMDGQHLKSAKSIESRGKALLEAWKDRPVMSLTPEDAEDWRTERRKTTTRLGGPPKPGTLNREVAQARRICEWGAEAKKIPTNPLARVRMEPEHNVREAMLTEPMAQRLIAVVDEAVRPKYIDQLRALIAIAFYAGMRRDEICLLQWSDITWAGSPEDDSGWNQGYISLSSWQTKNGTARVVPLLGPAREALKALKASQGKTLWVFQNFQTGRHYDSGWLYKLYLRCVKACGFTFKRDQKIVLHSNRHSWVRLCRKYNVPDKVAMKAGGWKTDTAFRRYGKVDDAEMFARMSTLDAQVAPLAPRVARAPAIKPKPVGSKRTRRQRKSSTT